MFRSLFLSFIWRYKCAFSFMKNDMYIYTRIYRLCHTILSVRSFNNAQQFSSFLDPLPRFHLRRFFVWMQISSLRYCFPWSLPLYSAVSPRLLFHPRHACARAYIRVCLCPYFRRMYRCILSNVFHSFFLDFLFSIPFRRSSVIFRPLYFVLEKSTYQRARDRFESILCWKVFFQYIYLEQ